MKKIIVYISIIIVILLSSCRSGLIIKRHYQKGYYSFSKKNENNLVASIDKNKLFYKSVTPPEDNKKTQHPIESATQKSHNDKIIPGDSIITIKKPGEKPIVQKFKTNTNHNISITKDYTRKAIYAKRYKKNSSLAIFVCLIPGLGAAACLTAWISRRKLRMKYDEHELIKENKIKLIIASFISFPFVLAILAFVVVFIVAIGAALS